jgi:transketolase
MAEYGMDAPALIRAVEKSLGKKLNIDENQLDQQRSVNVHSSAKAEAL